MYFRLYILVFVMVSLLFWLLFIVPLLVLLFAQGSNVFLSLLFVQHCWCFGHCLCNALVVLSAFQIISVENHAMLWRLFCSFYLGVDVCATLLLFWSFFHYQCSFVCDTLGVFLLLCCDCLCNTHAVLVIASNYGVVVHVMLLWLWLLFQFWYCCLYDLLIILVVASILVLFSLWCSYFFHFFIFGVVLCVMFLLFWSFFYFSVVFSVTLLCFLFIVLILVLLSFFGVVFSLALDVLLIVCEMTLLLQLSFQCWCYCLLV